MCYNVLCDKYATRQMYGYCPSWALDWEYRKKGILEEIRHYAADIISLQVRIFFFVSCHRKMLLGRKFRVEIAVGEEAVKECYVSTSHLVELFLFFLFFFVISSSDRELVQIFGFFWMRGTCVNFF